MIAPRSLRPWPQPIPVTVVVPTHNEAEGIGHLAWQLACLRYAAAGRYDLRFVFVDDGSRDETFARLLETFRGWPEVTVVRHDRNLGIAQAIQTGIACARTEWVCSLDADCSYDPLTLLPMLDLARRHRADMVTASPHHPSGGLGEVPRWRALLSRGASLVYRGILGQALHTYTSCCRVYRRSAVADLPLRHGGFAGVAELLGRLLLRGGRVMEYPAHLRVRRFGRSKLRLLRTIAAHLQVLLTLFVLRWTGWEPGLGGSPPAFAECTLPAPHIVANPQHRTEKNSAL
jgi:dolichol-phosphate mannosyltransferase